MLTKVRFYIILVLCWIMILLIITFDLDCLFHIHLLFPPKPFKGLFETKHQYQFHKFLYPEKYHDQYELEIFSVML